MKNKYRIENDIVLINLEKKGKDIGFFVIDLEDLERVSKYSWHLNARGYVSSRINNKLMTLHQFLMDGKSKIIDHKDRDKRNNKKDNLRFASHELNLSNHGKINVYKNKDKYIAQISINSKTIHLGSFETEKEAKEVYLKANKYKIKCLENNEKINIEKIGKRECYKKGTTGERFIEFLPYDTSRYRVMIRKKSYGVYDTLKEAKRIRDEEVRRMHLVSR